MKAVTAATRLLSLRRISQQLQHRCGSCEYKQWAKESALTAGDVLLLKAGQRIAAYTCCLLCWFSPASVILYSRLHAVEVSCTTTWAIVVEFHFDWKTFFSQRTLPTS